MEEVDNGLDLEGEKWRFSVEELVKDWVRADEKASLLVFEGNDGSWLLFNGDVLSCFWKCHLSETLAPIDFCLLKLVGVGSGFSVESTLSDQCLRIEETSLKDPECFSVVGEVTWLSLNDSLEVANFEAKRVTVPALRDAPLSMLDVLVALKLVANGDFCESTAGCHLSNTLLFPVRGESVFSWNSGIYWGIWVQYMYLYIKKFSCYMIYCREKKIDYSNKGKKMWRAYCNVEMSFTSTQSAESVIAKVPIIRYLTLKLWKHRIRQIMKIAMAVHFCVTLFENRGKKLTYWSW